MSKNYAKETICIQSGWQPKNGEARILPIYQSTTFKYETSEQMGRLFDLEENGYFYTFSEVWTHGLTLFLCGTLIMALTIVVYLTWINPSFIYDQCQIAITAYKHIGGEMGNEIASTLEKAMNQKLLPTPISLASNLISLGVFSGSILSMILAPFIRLCRPKQKSNENENNLTQQ